LRLFGLTLVFRLMVRLDFGVELDGRLGRFARGFRVSLRLNLDDPSAKHNVVVGLLILGVGAFKALVLPVVALERDVIFIVLSLSHVVVSVDTLPAFTVHCRPVLLSVLRVDLLNLTLDGIRARLDGVRTERVGTKVALNATHSAPALDARRIPLVADFVVGEVGSVGRDDFSRQVPVCAVSLHCLVGVKVVAGVLRRRCRAAVGQRRGSVDVGEDVPLWMER